MTTKFRREPIQIIKSAKGFIGSERSVLAPPAQMIADAYLIDGEPINRLTNPGQLIPNVQPLERAEVALVLSKKYPLPMKYTGYAITKNPNNWGGGGKW